MSILLLVSSPRANHQCRGGLTYLAWAIVCREQALAFDGLSIGSQVPICPTNTDSAMGSSV